MSDKIRFEKFRKEAEKQPYIAGSYAYDFNMYLGGMQSRDNKVKKLEEQHTRDLQVIVNSTAEIKKLKSQNEEMLKELEEVGNVLYYDIDGIGNLDVARNIIKKAIESQNV